MSSTKRLLLIALACGIALTTFTVFAPRAVHAVTAALVQVANTSANPVPISDSAPRFQAAVCTVLGTISTATNQCAASTNTFAVPTTTATGAQVKRLVVENVSGFCSSFQNANFFVKAVRLRGQFLPDAVPNGLTSFTHYVPMTAPPLSYVNDPSFGFPYGGNQETDYAYGQTTHFAFNPGDTVGVEAVTFLPGGTADYFCIARVEGYLITQ